MVGDEGRYWKVNCSNHMSLICFSGPQETEKSNISIIIPRSENPGKETEKSGFIIPRSENLGKETVKPDYTLSCEIIDETQIAALLTCTVFLGCNKVTNKNGFIIPRSENLGKETEKSGNIIP